MIFLNDFIGSEIVGRSIEFQYTGEERAFLNNLDTQPEDWYYRSANISYDYNSFGHRCIDVSKLDFDNYILFSGCSHTEGVGLEIEKTYPYLLSKKLNCDYYNLALAGTGIDVVEYNIVTWLFKYKKRPKAIIIQWPDISRFLSAYPGYKNFIPSGIWSEEKEAQKLLVYGYSTGIYYARAKLISDITKIAAGSIPYITFNYGGQTPINNAVFYLRKLDVARDLEHSGIKSHENFTNTLFDALTPMLR